ncbi:MAG: NAD(P)-dependent alcohol dehydrogenase [Candidatus Nanopelagicales bacterium]
MTTTTTMLAATQDRYGDADVLAVRAVPRPVVGDGEVLISVRAAGCGPDVMHVMTGKPYFARTMLGFTKPKQTVAGRDVAGVVVAVGDGVEGFAVGDEVYGAATSGSFAEYAVAPATQLAHKPSSLSFVEAAAVPVSGGTALQALQKAGVGEGSRVLVIGAGGGVGSFAVQIATALGARVTAMCSAGKEELVRSLGAKDVLDYARAEVDRDGAFYDVVVDTAGNRRISLLRKALKPGGTLVIVGGESAGGRLLGGFQRQLLLPLRAPFTRGQKLIGLISTEEAASYVELARLADEGSLRPVVGATYPLTQAADAVRDIAGKHTTGKIVVTVD